MFRGVFRGELEVLEVPNVLNIAKVRAPRGMLTSPEHAVGMSLKFGPGGPFNATNLHTGTYVPAYLPLLSCM